MASILSRPQCIKSACSLPCGPRALQCCSILNYFHILRQRSNRLPLAPFHYGDVIMGKMTSQITSLIIVYPTVYSGADQRKHQSSAALAFVRGIHRGSVNPPRAHKWPVTRKLFPFHDVIMWTTLKHTSSLSLSDFITFKPIFTYQISEMYSNVF